MKPKKFEREFEYILMDLRQQCFHMNDEEATVVVDEFIEQYPDILCFQTREWLIENS